MFILFYFDFLIIARYGILAILFILSPLAFVFRALPLESSKKLWQEWWQHFLKWCFVGVGLAFSMFLSSEILAKTGKNAITVAVVVLLVGIRMALKSGAPFAGLAMGMATAIIGAIVTGGASLAAGAAVGGAKMFGKATGTSGALTNRINKITDNIAEKYHGFRERIGLADEGSTNRIMRNRKARRVNKDIEATAEAAIAEGNIDAVVHGARYGDDAKKASYQKVLAEHGLLKTKLNQPGELEKAMENMTNHGIDVKEIIEKSPSLARYNVQAIRNLTQNINPDTGVNYTKDEAGDKLVKEAQRKANLAKISIDEFKEDNGLQLINNTDQRKLRNAINRGNLSIDRVDAIRAIAKDAERKRASALAQSRAEKAAGHNDLSAQLLEEAKMYKKIRDKVDTTFNNGDERENRIEKNPPKKTPQSNMESDKDFMERIKRETDRNIKGEETSEQRTARENAEAIRRLEERERREELRRTLKSLPREEREEIDRIAQERQSNYYAQKDIERRLKRDTK